MTKSEAKQKCLDDPVFLGQCLGYDMQEDVHTELFDALQTKKDKRLVLWPRGHFKTSAVVVFVVWMILRNPNIRILVMQATLPLTKGWIAEIRSHFDGSNEKSKLPSLFPEYCGDKKALKGSSLQFTVCARTRQHLKEATVTGASTRATKTGQHYDLMCFDDLVNTANFRNVELLDKLESEFYHFLPMLDPGTFGVLVTGTRYSFADIYARIIAKDKGIDEWEISVREVFRPNGALLFPQRLAKDGRKIGFTAELLASLKRDDPEMYAPQYLNRIMAVGTQQFPPELLMQATKASSDPEYPKNAPCIFMIDLAESQKKTADDSAIGVGSNDYQGRVWLKDMVGGKFSPHVLAQTIIEMFVKWRPLMIYVEKQNGAEFFGEFLLTLAREKGLFLPVDYIPVSKQKGAKQIRIGTLETAFRQGRLFLVAGATDYDKLTEELDQNTRGRHEDRSDCLALLYSKLSTNVPYAPAALKRLPFIFAVPHSTESPTAPVSPCGSGFAS